MAGRAGPEDQISANRGGGLPNIKSQRWSIEMDKEILVREWDCSAFHKRVLELESEGYTARAESYVITPEMDPETGRIIHLYAVEMVATAGG